MQSLEAWLAHRGPHVAALLEEKREPICDIVALRLETTFPRLCYDSGRSDAQVFQQSAYYETPRRFHRLVQVMLQFQAPQVVEREYRWGWTLLQRYGVERTHLLTQVQFYFEAARAYTNLDATDRAYLQDLESAVLRIVGDITRAPHAKNGNGHLNGNGYHPHE